MSSLKTNKYYVVVSIDEEEISNVEISKKEYNEHLKKVNKTLENAQKDEEKQNEYYMFENEYNDNSKHCHMKSITLSHCLTDITLCHFWTDKGFHFTK